MDINNVSLNGLIEHIQKATSVRQIQNIFERKLEEFPVLRPYINDVWSWLNTQSTMYNNQKHSLAEILSEFISADIMATLIIDQVKHYDNKHGNDHIPKNSVSDYTIWLFGNQSEINLVNRAKQYAHIKRLLKDESKDVRYYRSWMEKDFLRINYLLYNYADWHDSSTLLWIALLPILYGNPWFVYSVEKHSSLYSCFQWPEIACDESDSFMEGYNKLSKKKKQKLVDDFVHFLGLGEDRCEDTLVQILAGRATVYGGIEIESITSPPYQFAKYPVTRMFWYHIYREYGDGVIDQSEFRYAVGMTAIIAYINNIIQSNIDVIPMNIDINRSIPWIEEAKRQAFSADNNTWDILNRSIYWCYSPLLLETLIDCTRKHALEVCNNQEDLDNAIKKSLSGNKKSAYHCIFSFLSDSSPCDTIDTDHDDLELEDIVPASMCPEDRYVRDANQRFCQKAEHMDISKCTTIEELLKDSLLDAETVINASQVWWREIHERPDFSKIKSDYKKFLTQQLGLSGRADRT